MTQTPRKFFHFGAALFPVAVAIAYHAAGANFALGVLISGALLMINLFLWIIVVNRLVNGVANGGDYGGLQAFIVLKLLTLATIIVVLTFFFSPLAIMIGNSVMTLCVILPAFKDSLVLWNSGTVS